MYVYKETGTTRKRVLCVCVCVCIDAYIVEYIYTECGMDGVFAIVIAAGCQKGRRKWILEKSLEYICYMKSGEGKKTDYYGNNLYNTQTTTSAAAAIMEEEASIRCMCVCVGNFVFGYRLFHCFFFFFNACEKRERCIHTYSSLSVELALETLSPKTQQSLKKN